MDRSMNDIDKTMAIIKDCWKKQGSMNDVQRIAANSFALGLQVARSVREGEKNGKNEKHAENVR